MNIVHKWPAAEPDRRTLRPEVRGARPNAAAAAGDWLLSGLVLANLWWTTLNLGGYRPEILPVVATLNVLALVVWLIREVASSGGPRVAVAALGFLPFLGYAAVSAGWLTPVPWLGWQDWLLWAQMAVVFWVVSHGVTRPGPRALLFWGLAGLGVVAVALAAYQRFSDPAWLMLGRVQARQFLGRASGPFGIPNSLAAFLNLLLPPVLALTIRRGARVTTRMCCGYLALLFAAGLLLTLSRGAWLALGCALVAWPLLAGGNRPRRWLPALGVAAVLALVAGTAYWRDPAIRERVGLLVHHPLEPSRTVMWRAGWRLFAEHPLTGTGAGSYGVLFERHRPEQFRDTPRWAHNDYLNTLSDYGLIGFVLSFGAVAAAAWSWKAAPRPADDPRRALETGIAIGLLAFAAQTFVDFNLKIPALALAAAALAGLGFPPDAAGGTGFWRRSIRLPRAVPAVLALVALAALPAWILPLYRAEALRYAARQSLDGLVLRPPGAAEAARRLGVARERLAAAVRIDPRNAQAWSDLAEAIVRQARLSPDRANELGREAEAAASRALAQSTVVAEFWANRGQALDLQGRWRDAWADFVQALTLAPHRADLWYLYAYHLSLRDLESAKAAVATCLGLDPWNGPALAFRNQLGGSQ